MKYIIIILCLAGFAASGVILDRPQANYFEGGQNDVDRFYTMTRDDLLRQKFILDVLKLVELPLENYDFYEVGLEAITDPHLFIGPLDDDMLLVLDLIRSNRILGKTNICSFASKQHLRQLIGLYRLFVRSRDFESLQRLVIYARKNVNPVLFVNALTLALDDRVDTQRLIVPALYEILPRLFNMDSLIRVVDNVGPSGGEEINRNIGSLRPNLRDIIELKRSAGIWNQRYAQRGFYGGIIDKSQLWMPWREMHRQLALQKSLGGRVIFYDQAKQDVSVRPIMNESVSDKKLGQIAEDVGLKTFLNILLDELIVEQGNIQNSLKIDQNLHTTKIENNIVSGIRGVDRNRQTNTNEIGYEDNLSLEVNRLQYGNSIDIEQNLPNSIIKHKIESSIGDTDGLFLQSISQDQKVDSQGELNQRPPFNDPNVERNHESDNDTRPWRLGLGNIIKNAGIQARNSLTDWLRIANYRRQDYVNRNTNTLLNRDNIETRQNRIVDERLQNNDISQEIRKDFNNRQSPADRSQNTFADIKPGYTDESNWLNAQHPKEGINNWKSLDEDLPTTSINSDRLLHVGSRRLRLIEGKQLNRNMDDILGQKERRVSDIAKDNNVLLSNGPLKRLPRTLSRIANNDRRQRFAELIFHHLQQLVARLNIEDISLQKGNNFRNSDANYLLPSLDNDVHIDELSKPMVLQQMNDISKRMENSMQQILLQLRNRQTDDDNQIDKNVVLHQLAMSAILQELVGLAEYVQDGQFFNILENPTIQYLLRYVIKTVDQHIEKIKGGRNIDEITNNDIKINDFKVDGLRTFLEDADIDLSNINDVTKQRSSTIIIGQRPSLNHKPFIFYVDLISERFQRVVVRTFVGPKTDALGYSLEEQRRNFVLLDIANVNLRQGRNIIKRKSQDITWTGRDVTTYSEIYERVLKALQGDIDVTNEPLNGQTTLFPQRLLLPRGRVEGLPMQVLIVITPATEDFDRYKRPGPTRLGMDSLVIDNLPIRYPLDRVIGDVQKLLSLANVYTEDVVIYHDDRIKGLTNE